MEKQRYHIFRAININSEDPKNPIYYCAGTSEINPKGRGALNLVGSRSLPDLACRVMDHYLARVGAKSGPDLEYSEIEKRHAEIVLSWDPLFIKNEYNGLELDCAYSLPEEEKVVFSEKLKLARIRAFLERKYYNLAVI